MRKLFLMVCGCAAVFIMLFLYLGLSEWSIVHGAERNVNLQNGFYVVCTSCPESLRQLYSDIGQHVIYDSLPKPVIAKLTAACKITYPQGAKFAGIMLELSTMNTKIICAIQTPPPPALQHQVCTMLNVGEEDWVWAWVNLHGDQFGCKVVGPPRIGV